MFVRKLPRKALLTLLAAALLIAGCNMGATEVPTVDVNAINTAAVATALGQVSAQLTETALAAPSPTPLPTNTLAPLPTSANALPTANTGAIPTLSFNTTPVAGFTQLASPAVPAATISLGDACHNSAYEADVTIPDGTVLKPGEDFTKIWKIRNTGTCTWDEGFTFAFIAGDNAMDPRNFEFQKESDFVASGEAIDIGIKLTAPLTEGKYQGNWRMRSDSGTYFGETLTVVFEVKK